MRWIWRFVGLLLALGIGGLLLDWLIVTDARRLDSLARGAVEAFNAGRWDSIASILADRLTLEGFEHHRGTLGRAQVVKAAQELRRALAPVDVTVLELKPVVDGLRATVEWKVKVKCRIKDLGEDQSVMPARGHFSAARFGDQWQFTGIVVEAVGERAVFDQ